jgi:hypothetical protein
MCHTLTRLYATESGNLPDINNILNVFLRNAPHEPGPYFEGYCGEHTADYPEIEQKAGPPRSDSKYSMIQAQFTHPFTIEYYGVGHAHKRAAQTTATVRESVSRQQLRTSSAFTRVARRFKANGNGTVSSTSGLSMAG